MANIQAIIDAIDSITDREINLFNNRFETILKNIKKRVEINAVMLIDNPLEFDMVFNQILDEEGYYSLVNDFIDNSYDKTYSQMKALLEETGIAVTFTEADLNIIRDLKILDIQTFRDIGNKAASQLKRDLYKYSLSNLSQAEIADNIAQSLLGTDFAKYSNTYAETSISQFQQSVLDAQVSEIADQLVYIYVGPTPDGKIREFCRCVMNQHKYYSLADSNALKDDSRRKWNCRHKILGIRKEKALERGYEAGNFSC